MLGLSSTTIARIVRVTDHLAYPLSERDRMFLWKSLLGYFPPAPFTFIRAYKGFIKPFTVPLGFHIFT
jgi:hypothetical protein